MQLSNINQGLSWACPLRGTCAETEDATFINCINLFQFDALSEALALKQRMQHTNRNRYSSSRTDSQRHLRWNRGCNMEVIHGLTGSSLVSEALALKQRMQLLHGCCGYFWEIEFQRHLRWNRGCNWRLPIAMVTMWRLSEALALKQRMQHTYVGRI